MVEVLYRVRVLGMYRVMFEVAYRVIVKVRNGVEVHRNYWLGLRVKGSV